MAFTRKVLPGLQNLITNIQRTIQTSLLPSGAIVWFGNRSTAPSGWAICDGTNGTPNLIGKYPLGATSNIGGPVAAGLPNIKGTFAVRGNSYQNGSESGAMWAVTNGVVNNQLMVWSANEPFVRVTIDASRSSSVYGNSNTVTPPSVKLLPCMKL